MNSTLYEAPHYVVSSNVLLLEISWVKVSFSAICFQKLSVYILPLMSEIKFRINRKLKQNYYFAYSNFYILRLQKRRQKFLKRTATELQIHSVLNFVQRIRFIFITSRLNSRINHLLLFYCFKYDFFPSNYRCMVASLVVAAYQRLCMTKYI
jgi:hypothetical protein